MNYDEHLAMNAALKHRYFKELDDEIARAMKQHVDLREQIASADRHHMRLIAERDALRDLLKARNLIA